MLLRSIQHPFRFLAVPAAAAALVLALGTTAPAQAQGYGGAQGQQGQTQGQTGQPSFDQGDLKSFATASLQVQAIGQRLRDQVSKIEDPNKMQEIQRQANEEMVQAVQDAGLSVEKYNAISQAMQRNPEVREKVTELQKQAR